MRRFERVVALPDPKNVHFILKIRAEVKADKG
jgi:hypothetical protein